MLVSKPVSCDQSNRELGLSKLDQSPTTWPNRPTATRFWPEPKVQSVGGGFPFSRTDTGGSSGGFASP